MADNQILHCRVAAARLSLSDPFCAASVGLREAAILRENPNLFGSGGGSEEPAPAPRRGPEGLLPILWRQRALVGGCAAACLFLACVYLLFATPIYTSTAQMSVRLAPSRLTGEAQAVSDFTAGNYLYTEGEIVKSPTVLALAAQMPQVKPLLAAQPDPILYLHDWMNVDVGKRDTIIRVSFSSPNREAAATVANAIVSAYMAYQTKPKQSDTATLQRLDDESQRLEREIAGKSEQMRTLEQQYGVLTTTADRDSLADRRLAEMSRDLHAAHLETLKAQAENTEAKAAVDRMRRAGIDTDSADADMLALGPDQEALIRTEILQLAARLQDLRQHYLPDHPYVQNVQRRINQLEVIYARAVERRFLVTRQREQDLQAAFDDQQRHAIDLSAKSAEYLRLQASVQNDHVAQENLAQRRRAIEFGRDLGMLDINPFQAAEPELKASHPSKRLTLAVALLLGLVLGGGIGYLRDWLDDRFRTMDEIKDAMGVPLLGSIPRLPQQLPAPIAGQQAILEPASGVAEACRTVRTAIYFGAPKDRCHTLLITSPAPDDGKSTLASNLAITMAQAGKRVLLVDADLRLPSQHKIFGVSNDAGLSSLLEGQATLDNAVRQTEVNGLEVLPCGPTPHNPAEMLNSAMFNELLEVLSDRYDQVVIDSPPATGVADARIIAASCDVTILVLRHQKSTRRLSEAARDGLNSVGAHLLGMVVNDLAHESADAYEAYGYYRQQTSQLVDSALKYVGVAADSVHAASDAIRNHYLARRAGRIERANLNPAGMHAIAAADGGGDSDDPISAAAPPTG